MKVERVELSDGKLIVFVWMSKTRYVRVTEDSVTIGRRKKTGKGK